MNKYTYEQLQHWLNNEYSKLTSIQLRAFLANMTSEDKELLKSVINAETDALLESIDVSQQEIEHFNRTHHEEG